MMLRNKGILVHMQTPHSENNIMEKEYLKVGTRAPEVTLSDKLHFGKHKGKTVKLVLSKHPSYLMWAHKNNIITLPKRLYQEVKAGAKWEKYKYLCDSYIDRCVPYDE